MKTTWNLLFVLLLGTGLFGQAGIEFKAGLSQAKNADINITPDGTQHNGYYIGADAILNEGNMYLMLGAQYHDMAFIANNSSSYFSHETSMNWIKIRTGLGFNIVNFSKNIQLTARLLGSLNVISSYPEDMLDIPYNQFNSGTAGVVLGAGLQISQLGFGFEYEKGYFNAVNMMDGTNFDFMSVYLAFRI